MQLNPWGAVRSTLMERFSFGQIKKLVGYAGFDMARMAHLEQKQERGASKSQLLSAIDTQYAEHNESSRNTMVTILCERMAAESQQAIEDLAPALAQLGWQLVDGRIVPLEIFDFEDLAQLPDSAASDLRKAATRLRDGDLSGAVSSACAAVDAVTEQIYATHGLGKSGGASFQEKVRKSLNAIRFQTKLEGELRELGWDTSKIKMISSNFEGSLNQAANVMQTLRSDMGDVHGTKPAVATLAFDSVKWAALLLRALNTA